MNTYLSGFEQGPPVTLICESPAKFRELREAASAARATVLHELGPQEAKRHFGYGRPTGTILADVTECNSVEAMAHITMASEQAKRNGDAMILSATTDCLDSLADVGLEPHVHWLCKPDLNDWVAALSLEISASQAGFADVSTDMDQQRLRRLADEVSRIARSLANLSGGQTSGLSGPRVNDMALAFHAETVDLDDTQMPSVEEIRGLLRLRRMRDQFFDPSLFADPAWDMLLDLMAARLERAQVAVSSLCIAAAVPPTTALRWIKTMADQGLLERCADPDDGRRIFIRLADHAASAMARYFAAAKRISNGPFGAI